MFLEEIFSTRMHIKVLRALAEKNTAYSLEELMLETTGSRGAVHKVIADFKRLEIVKIVKGKGKREFYKLNSDSMFYQTIMDIFQKEKLHRKSIPLNIWNKLERFSNESSKKMKNIKSIYLFGSVARGDYTPHSDIDILILFNSIEERERILIKRIFNKYFKEGSLIVEKVSGWENQKKEKTRLSQEIEKEGIELWKR